MIQTRYSHNNGSVKFGIYTENIVQAAYVDQDRPGLLTIKTVCEMPYLGKTSPEYLRSHLIGNFARSLLHKTTSSKVRASWSIHLRKTPKKWSEAKSEPTNQPTNTKSRNWISMGFTYNPLNGLRCR